MPGPNEPTPALRIEGLRKSFARPAVDGLDLLVRPGEIYALLGPNGAGKTTTLRMVVGLIAPDAGSIHVCGVDRIADPIGAKRLMAWLPDEPMIYDRLSPREYLGFVAGLWQVEPRLAAERSDRLLALLELDGVADERCEGFSRGMRQKVSLAGALIHDPQLLILDEPLTGLDAAMARQVKAMLLARVRAGGAVVITTHILEVAERMADRIGIIRNGRLLAEGRFEELRAAAGAEHGTLEEIFLDLVAPGERDAMSGRAEAAAS
jgi:ABC-2 type transport system ATP-binding protein